MSSLVPTLATEAAFAVTRSNIQSYVSQDRLEPTGRIRPQYVGVPGIRLAGFGVF